MCWMQLRQTELSVCSGQIMYRYIILLLNYSEAKMSLIHFMHQASYICRLIRHIGMYVGFLYNVSEIYTFWPQICTYAISIHL